MIPIFDVYEWARAVHAIPEKGEMYGTTFNIGVFKQSGPGTLVLQEFNRRTGHLIVGVPAFNSCIQFSRCKSCFKKHKNKMEKLAFLRDKYNKIDWKFTNGSHAKYMVCGDFAMGGGRNVSDSDWEDLSFLFKDAKIAEQLRTHWHSVSANCYDIGSDGPLVCTSPYKGELMADSSSIPDDFKQAVIKDKPNTDCATYWSKNA